MQFVILLWMDDCANGTETWWGESSKAHIKSDDNVLLITECFIVLGSSTRHPSLSASPRFAHSVVFCGQAALVSTASGYPSKSWMVLGLITSLYILYLFSSLPEHLKYSRLEAISSSSSFFQYLSLLSWVTLILHFPVFDTKITGWIQHKYTKNTDTRHFIGTDFFLNMREERI